MWLFQFQVTQWQHTAKQRTATYFLSYCTGPDHMASSEEEGEIVEDCVTDYFFVDSKNELMSFSSLPLRWDDYEGEGHGEAKRVQTKHAFLRGMVENGCGQIYRKVIAWKFVLSYVLPEIYVLQDTKYERWIKLQRPRNSYENTVRAILISIHYLHFIKKNLEEESMEELWKHIRKTFCTYEVPPSENDLVDHLHLIKEAALRDKDIAKAKNLPLLLSQISGKRKVSREESKTRKKSKFIVYEDDANIDGLDDSSDADKDELFDNVCALCDDGGEVLCCEGRCIRSFHPTIASGAHSFCESLCYTSEQVHAIRTFLCKNCKYQLHQCFICGRLGNSDKSLGAEVFPCVSATCGHFYHPHCLSKLLFPGDENQAQELQKQIKAGDSFTCPAHKCAVCKQGEDKNVPEMQFAICRRCPKSYHCKCLPRDISFKRNNAKNIPRRAWMGLLTKRILIYCMDHKIYRKILTPRRDHLLFPNDDGKRDQHRKELLQGKLNVMSARRSKAFGILSDGDKMEKLSKGIIVDLRSGDSINKNEKNLTNLSSSMTFSKNVDTSKWRSPKKPSPTKKIMLPQISVRPVSTSSMKRVPEKAAAENVPTGSTVTLRTAEMENRIPRLMKNSISSINMEEFLGEQRMKCTHDSSSHFQVDKTITLGKVELSVQAIQAALKKLQEGGTIKDAKAICEPAILTQMIRWKKKLGVYLSPFIHGMRYTSFGRHFTKVDKLKQVVDRLRWYLQDGDTIVDFCCGSNDFSCLLKEELDRMGISCSFKNYDLIQPKNDFNFEKRDWMSVGLEELPEGSKLILGLNPPFGVQAFHANQFIDKALTFRPKLLLLTVPKETERLDRKKTPYDLIWEDDHIFSGKAFYLPGSVDVHDQQIEQWNLEPPPLYLWSRPDWTAKHNLVALEHGHLIKNQDTEYSVEISPNAVPNYLVEENQDRYGDFSTFLGGNGDINCMLEDLPEPSDDI